MKIYSEECIDALKNYETSSPEEEIVIELLLIPEEDDESYRQISYKICDEGYDIDELANIVLKIRNELNIEK